MKDQYKTKTQLIEELETLRKQIVKLKKVETKRKRAEGPLRESQARFHTVFEKSATGIGLTDLGGRLLNANPAFVQMLGYTRKELTGKSFLEFTHPDDLEKERESFRQIKKGKSESLRMEKRYVRKDGQLFWANLTASLCRDDKGVPQFVMGMVEDITERKRAEEALRENEERLQLAITGSNGGLWDLEFNPDDPPNVIPDEIYLSASLKRFIGYEDEFPNSIEAWKGRILPEDLLILNKSAQNHLEGRADLHEAEYRIRHKDGSIRWIYTRGKILRDKNGRPIRWTGVDWDITERKRVEERLESLNECLVSFGSDPIENINRLVALCGEQLSGTCALYNRLENGLLHSVGQWNTPPDFVSVEKPDGHICFDLIQSDSSEACVIRNLQQTTYAQSDSNVSCYNLKTYIGKTVSFGDTIIGSLCVVYQEDYIPSEDDKNFLGIIASAIGVEEKRRHAEDALLFTRFSLDNAVDTMVCVDRDARFIDVNDAFCRSSGYSREELLSMTVHDIDPDYSAEIWPEFWEKLKQSGSLTFETCHRSKEGRIFPIEITANYLEYKGKEYHCGFARDITERKRAEEALRRKSGEQDLLLDNIQTQIWYLVDKETYGAVNKARANFFGKKKEEIENKKVYDLLGKDEAEICMSGYAEVFEKRKQIHTEEWIMKAKGEKRLLSIIKSPKLNENGDVEYVVCSAEDVTDRRRTEEEIHTYQEKLRSLSSELSLIEERERRRIATDLHDYIGQTLAVIKIKLGALREMISPSGPSGPVDDIQNLIDQAIHYTRSLTSDLSPPVLYELGFDAAVEWLIEQIQNQHHILVDFEDDRQSKPMSDEIRISLFKAVRELLTNIVKHAKVHKAKVSTRREDNIIRIIVEDDGVGFPIPEDKPFTQIGGFGLFSIRERLRHLGGNFEIESNPGQGTRVILVAPLTKEENNNRSVT